jgi:tetratricopeptide (TPR) repeat protein
MNPHNKRQSLFVLAMIACCALMPARARAESDKRQQAKEHYEKATRLYDVGKYGDAISEYEEAYLLVEDAALLFNIGQAYRLWDRPEEALRAYKNYLRRRPDASNRADVEKKIADLEKVIDDRHHGTTTTPPAVPPPVQPVQAAQPEAVPASVSSPPPSSPPPSSSPPSSPSLSAPPPSAPPAAEASAQNVEAPQPPAVSSETPAALVAQPAAPIEPAPRSNWLAYSFLGVGGACLITAGIAAGVGYSKTQKMQTAADNHQPFDPAVQANGKTANAIAVVAGLAGVATGVVGGYLLWRGKGSAPQATVAAVVTPGFSGGTALITF